MPSGGRGVGDPSNFPREFRRYPFVGIDLDNPLAATSVDPGMAARPFPLPGAFDETLGKAQCDLAGTIAAAVLTAVASGASAVATPLGLLDPSHPQAVTQGRASTQRACR